MARRPEQGNEGITTAITVVGESVTVYCGERMVEYFTWEEMAKCQVTNSYLEGSPDLYGPKTRVGLCVLALYLSVDERKGAQGGSKSPKPWATADPKSEREQNFETHYRSVQG